MKQPEKFDKKLNMDTATSAEIESTNEELVDYLDTSGEKVAAEQVQYLMDNQSTPESKKDKKNPINAKLLSTNRKILSVLEKIYRDQTDEQDTGFKDVEQLKHESKFLGPAGVKDTRQKSMNAGMMFGGGGSLGLDLDRKNKKKGKGGKGSPKNPKRVPMPDGGKGGQKPDPKSPQKTSSTNTKTPKSTKVPKKIPVKTSSIIKKIAGMGKAIPVLGVALAAGSAIYSALDGYNSADVILGKDEAELTTTEKIASAAGMVVSDFTFGVIDPASTANILLNKKTDAAEAAEVAIKKYESMGLIDHDIIGNSEIEDWMGVEKLPPQEIQKIIDFDDWSDTDKEKLIEVKERSIIREKLIAQGTIDPASSAVEIENTVTKTLKTENNVNEIQKIIEVKERDVLREKLIAEGSIDPTSNITEIENTVTNVSKTENNVNEIKKYETQIQNMDNSLTTLVQQKVEAMGSGDVEKVEAIDKAITAIGQGRSTLTKKVEQMKNEVSAQSPKPTSSGVDTSIKKTSDLGNETTEVIKGDNGVEVIIEKKSRDAQVEQSSQNLRQSMQTYDGRTAGMVSNTIAPMLSQRINTTNVQPRDGSERILNLFP